MKLDGVTLRVADLDTLTWSQIVTLFGTGAIPTALAEHVTGTRAAWARQIQ